MYDNFYGVRDKILVDLEREGVINKDSLYTKCGNTPYDGKKLKGMPVTTIVRGAPVMENLEIVGKPGYGRFTKPLQS